MPTNTIFTDTLVRANSNPLSGGYTTLTGNNALQLVSDNVEGTTIGSPNAAIYTGGTWPADQGISIVIGALANTSTIGVLLRGSVSLNTAYICNVVGTAGVSGTWQIQLDNSGVVTVLNSGPVTPALGDTLYAFVQGTTITFQQNGVTLGTATDATISAGDAGLYAEPATTLTDVIISGPVQGLDFVAVTVSPTSLNTVLGGQTTFAAAVSGQGVSTSSVTWFVDGLSGGNATIGTISAAGLYVAPSTAIPAGGSVTVTAQSQADNTTISIATTVGIYRTATIQSYAPNDGANLTNFKTTCMLFNQNLPTLGWTQVPLATDVGQVQWANVTSANFPAANFAGYFDEENCFSTEIWTGAWVPGTTYVGSYNNGNTVDLVTYSDVNHPQITWNATANGGTGSTGVGTVVANTAQSFPITSVATSAGSVAVYTGTFGAATWTGYIFVVTGFANANNNGSYVCTVATATQLTLSNPSATAQSSSATATSSASNVGFNAGGGFGVGVGAANSWFGSSFGTFNFGNAGNNQLTVLCQGSSGNFFGGLVLSGGPAVSAAGQNGSISGIPPTGNSNTFNSNFVGWQPFLYEIYQSTDALSATCPIFLRLQYFFWQTNGQSGNSFSRISMVISVGTAIGANGNPSNQANGTLSGNVAAFSHYVNSTYSLQQSGEFILNQFTGSGTTVPQECDFSGNAGNLRVCMFRQASQFGVGAPLYFSIERAKDANGNDLDTYFTVNVSGGWFTGIGNAWGYTGMNQSTVFKPGTGSATNGTNWLTLGFNQSDMAFSGLIPAFPVFPCPGYVGNPLLGTIVVALSDAVTGELARCVVYGQSHTYLMLGGAFSLTQNSPGQTSASVQFGTVGMLWENV